jgi:hypothetical protein
MARQCASHYSGEASSETAGHARAVAVLASLERCFCVITLLAARY